MNTKTKQAEKIVEIKRKYGFIDEANADPQVREYLDMAYRAIGSYWQVIGKIHASGMTREEENIIMPDLVGAYPEDDRKTFRQGVENYFANINTRVPAEGLKLNIALQQPGKPLSIDNPPANPVDYVAWKHALGHVQVGPDKNTAERYDHVKFYIVDKDAEIKASGKLLKLENEATAEYLQIQADPNKVDQALTVLGYDLKMYQPGERTGLLRKEATVVTDVADEVNQERLKKFISTVTDKHLKIKYDILNMISAHKLTRIGNRILLAESQTVIGNDLMEAVYWFLDKKNSGQVNALYVQMEELGLKPATRLDDETPKKSNQKIEVKAPIVEAKEEDLGDMDSFTDDSGEEVEKK